MLTILTSGSFWFSVLASTTPVMLATIAANILTKSGVFNLGIEGTMLICALSGVLVSAYTSSLFFGALFGVLMGILISFMLGYFTLILNAPMNACGVAINLLASGGTVFVLATLTGSKVTSAALKSLTFPTIHIPFIRDIPFLGAVLSGHNLITYLGWALGVLTWVLLFKTKLGLSIRAVGENEDAARSAGININGMKFISLTLCGIFCAFGGMYLSMGALRSFTAGMVSGRGFLSLAMDAMSRGNPLVGMLSSLLYGFSDTITVYLQLYSNMDLKMIDAFPYVFIIFVLFIVHLVRRGVTKRRESLTMAKHAKAAQQ